MSLEVAELSSGYGEMLILRDISLSLEEDELGVVIGPNGAGKTTLLRSVFQLSMVTIFKGEVNYRGHSLLSKSADEMANAKITFMPAGSNVFSSLTVYENLEMADVTQGTKLEKRLEVVFELFPRIKERQSQKAGTLSGGERQMLAMSCALIPEPNLVLLDEPSGGLQPNLVDKLFETIHEINDRGTTVLMVEQAAEGALKLADKGWLLEGGEIGLAGPAKELLQNEELAQEYFSV